MRDANGQEKQHGKVYRWLDNFWYHHKWKTIISLFLVLAILVCTLQMCTKEDPGDLSVVIAGSYNPAQSEAAFIALRGALSSYIPEDYDKNGELRADLVYYTIYSEQQIKDFAKQVDENGDPAPVYVDTAFNANEYKSYNDYMMTGESSIVFMERWIFDSTTEKNASLLVDIVAKYGVEPQGAVYVTDESGNRVCCGVRLGDTELYKNNAAIRVLPEDTVLALYAPLVLGKSGKTREYQKVLDTYAAFVGLN